MNLNKIIALVLAWQMAFSPIAFAQSSSSGDDLASMFRTGLGLAQGFQERINIQQAQQQAALQQQALMAQMNPRSCNNRQCTSPIFPECNILVTRANVVEPAVCTPGGGPSVNQDPATQQGKLVQAWSYKNHFAQTENIYANFLTEGNQQNNEGLTCLNNQATALENRLKAREDEIDNLIAKMQVAHDDFKQRLTAARAIEQVEEGQSELTGKPQAAYDRVMARDSQRFAKSFGDAACQTVLGADKVNTLARNGLVGIESELTTVANKKGAGRGSFNAMEFNATTASALEADIRRVADLNSRSVNSNVASWLSRPNNITSSSAYGLDGQNGPMSSIVGEIHQEARIENDTLNQEVAQYLDSSASSQSLATALNGTSEEAFNRAITNFENSTTNNCLVQSPNIAGLLSNAIRMEDPQVSRFANENANNSYLEFIRTTLNNPNQTIEQKMDAIRSFQGQGSNSKYVMRLQGSMVIPAGTSCPTTIDPTQRMTPADFIGCHVQNCRAQFNSNPISNGATGSQIVSRARASRARITAFRSNLSNRVKATIVDRLVNCADGLQANATGVATCSEKNLSSSTPGFCVRNAISCSTNMRSCLTKATTEVQRVTAKRDADVRTYKVALTTHNNAMQAMYREVTRILSLEGLQIQNSQLRQGLVLPADVQLVPEFKDARTFIKGLEVLEMEDPDAYLKLTKTNLQRLKNSLKTQREEIMNGDGDSSSQSELARGVMGHIRQVASNMEAEKARAERYRDQCNEVLERYSRDYQRQQEAMAKAANERAQQEGEFCSHYASLSSSPGCEEADTFDTIIEAGVRAGPTATRDLSAIREFRRHCRRYNSDANQDVEAPTGNSLINAATTACREPSGNVELLCRQLQADDVCEIAPESVPTSAHHPALFALYEAIPESDRPSECANKITESSIDPACWTKLRRDFFSAREDSSVCGDGGKNYLRAEIVRPSRRAGVAYDENADARRWREINENLGQQSSGACTAQNGSSIMDAALEGLNSGSGTPGASIEGFGR